MDGGRVLLDAGARAVARAPAAGRARTELWAERAAGDGGRSPRASARCWPGCRGRRCGHGGAAAAGGARARGDRGARAAARRAPHVGPRGRRRAHRRPGGGGRGDRARRRRALCCTASPARARPRSTCARARRRSARAAGVIVLVPEIALTPQTVARFQARFGDTVAVLHSALGDGRALRRVAAAAHAARRGSPSGPRSAVFAPVADLGLIVVDEEHDASYKHEGDPRYDARRVAAERRAARRARCCVAGSATPRPETWRALPRLRLPEPRRRPRRCRPSRCSTCAARAARCTRDRARGARGRAQGDRAAQPPRLVELPLLPHLRPRVGVPALRRRARAAPRRGRDRLPPLRPPRARCPARCDDCGSLSVARHGAGHRAARARAGEAARRAACSGSTPTRRRAADAAASSWRASSRADRGRAARHPDGGQGPRLPRRRRSASCSTPTSTLRFPDFRAEERTFALVAQLAGPRGPRRGRRARARADARPRRARRSRAAAHHDADGFLAGELERRRALRYPPFADLIRVVCSAAEAGAPAAAAGALRASARRGARAGRRERARPAPLFRLRGASARQVVVKAADRAAAVAAIGAAVDALAADRAHRDVAFSVDVDPQ